MKLKRIRSTSAQELSDESGCRILISYETCVAAYIDNQWFKTEKRHSTTTSKHVNQWLRSYGIDPKQTIQRSQDDMDKLINYQRFSIAK